MFAAGKTSGGLVAQTYVDDVFSTYLYNGTSSAQTITNGIDLSGQGGLVWMKSRSDATYDHCLIDTVRGSNKVIQSNQTTGDTTVTNQITAFSSSGFSLGTNASVNSSSAIYTSWTFRKAPKFFDVVTYTGNGANRTIAHSLGQVPGCIIVKRTDTTADWQVYHRSVSNTEYLVLNTTAGKATGTTRWNSTTPTATEFSLGTDTTVNANTGTYVAYLFSHDTTSDGLIQCGSYNGDLNASVTVNIGWEPQFLLIKNRGSATTDWLMLDIMRGMTGSTASTSSVYANANFSETTAIGVGIRPTATGFFVSAANNLQYNDPGSVYIYIAIRRPNKPPTSGTQVFQPTVYTGTNVDNRLVNTTIAPDMVWVRQRDDTVLGGMVVGDRARTPGYLLTGTTAGVVSNADSFDQQIVSTTEYGTSFSAMNGFWCGNNATAKLNINTTSNNHIAEAFKRAPGVFDVVLYDGTGANTTQAHNLGVVPELILVKRRGTTGAWAVYSAAISNTEYLVLNTNAAKATGTTYWNSTTPTASVFSLGTAADVNSSLAGNTYVAHLFASAAGISKVGTYTGNGGTAGTNGTSQTINCGFSAGARFVLIKRTDSTGDWYVFDSARGIVAGNDPYLLTNSTAAEVTSVDAVDADNSGFVVNQTSGTDLNVTSATYIYLAYA